MRMETIDFKHTHDGDSNKDKYALTIDAEEIGYVYSSKHAEMIAEATNVKKIRRDQAELERLKKEFSEYQHHQQQTELAYKKILQRIHKLSRPNGSMPQYVEVANTLKKIEELSSIVNADCK